MTEALRPRPGLFGPGSPLGDALGRRPWRREAGPDEGGRGDGRDKPRGGGLDAGRGAVARASEARLAIADVGKGRLDGRHPYHVGVFLGLSAGLYAVSLAGVTALQSGSDQAVAAERATSAAAIEAMKAGHDDLDRRVSAAVASYQSATAAYQRTADALAALETELGKASASVAGVTGSAASVPAQLSLPSLPKLSPIAIAAPAPVVHATTGASGKP